MLVTHASISYAEVHAQGRSELIIKQFNSPLLIPLTTIIHCQRRIKLSDLQLFYARKWVSTWISKLFEVWVLGSHYWLIFLNFPQPSCRKKYFQIFPLLQRVITSKRAKFPGFWCSLKVSWCNLCTRNDCNTQFYYPSSFAFNRQLI